MIETKVENFVQSPGDKNLSSVDRKRMNIQSIGLFSVFIQEQLIMKYLSLIAIAFVMASCQMEQGKTESAQVEDPSLKNVQDHRLQLELADNSIGYPYTQKELGFGFDALEPYFDKETMEIHYSRHHAGYTSKFNAAVEANDLDSVALFAMFDKISTYPAAVRNNGGGYYNHLLFWQVLAPDAGGEPSGDLAQAIAAEFGSFEEFKNNFGTAAAGVFGSGWAWLSVNSDGNLFISSTPNQDNPLMDVVAERGIPILTLDVWEHAYYLKYQNKRPDYISTFWEVVNWKEVERRYAEIGNLTASH